MERHASTLSDFVVRLLIWRLRLWLRMEQSDTQPLHTPRRRLEYLELQVTFFHDVAGRRYVPGDLGNQTRNGRGFPFIRAHTKELVQSIDVHVAGHDVGVFVLANDIA